MSREACIHSPEGSAGIFTEFHESEECMRTYIITVTITPMAKCKTCENGYKAIDKSIMFRITATPLTVSFDRLVSALTCPDFDLGNLQKDVAWSVLRAAVGTNPQEICSKEKNPFEGSDGYTWAVAPNQTALTYVAKKNGTPMESDYDLKIVFNGAEPTVWVKDVPDNACDEVKSIFTPELEKQYQSYNLHLVINNSDCLSKYGYAEKTELSRALGGLSGGSKLAAVYGSACLIGTLSCAVVTGSTGVGTIEAVKTVAKDTLINCGVGAVIAGALAGASAGYLEQQIGSSTAEAGIYSGLFGGLAAAYGYSAYRSNKLLGLYNKVKYTGSFKEWITIKSNTVPSGEIMKKTDLLTEIIRSHPDKYKHAPLDNTEKLTEYAIDHHKELAKDIEDLAKAAKEVAKEDETYKELAERLDNIAEALESEDGLKISKAVDNLKGIKEKDLKKITEIPKKLEDLLEKRIKNLNKASICGPLGTALGASAASIYALTTVGDVDYLNVAIKTDPIATIHTEKPVIPNEACISVNGAECPWMK